MKDLMCPPPTPRLEKNKDGYSQCFNILLGVQAGEIRQENKRHRDWKGKENTIFINTWRDWRIYNKATGMNKWF